MKARLTNANLSGARFDPLVLPDKRVVFRQPVGGQPSLCEPDGC